MTRLLVLTPRVGAISETFIAAHIAEVAPGSTEVVCRQVIGAREPCYHVVDARRGSKAMRDWVGHQLRRTGRRSDAEWVPSPEAWATYERLLEREPQAVLVEYLDQFTKFAEEAARRSIPVFIHAHGYDASARLRSEFWRRRYVELASVATLIVVSDAMRSNLEGIGISSDAMVTIPYGVAVNSRSTAPVVRQRRPFLDCLVVGRLVPKKNIVPLLEAVALLARRGIEVRMTIVGSGPTRRRAVKRARHLGLGERVRFAGALDHDAVLGLMRSADVFVQNSVTDPSTGDQEGLPVAILEAMAAGLPVVASDHAGIPESVVDGHNGLICTPNDVAAFADALALLHSDVELRSKMGRNGRDLARERFSRDREIKALQHLIFPTVTPRL